MVVLERVAPRVRHVPAYSASLGAEAIDLARHAGLELDDWQADVLEASLAVDEESRRWASFEVGVNVARQNGKGGILEARELAGLFLVGSDRLLIHTAHEADTSFEAFYRLEALIQDTPDLHARVKDRSGYTHSHGQESINLKDGKRILFKTRTHGGRRGFSGDLLIFDEAMFIPEFTHGALLPILSARGNPQVWYTGSAVDQEIHQHGVVFARVRERGHRGEPGLVYFEWSLPAGSPGEVSDELAADAGSWAQANPALGSRISEEHVAHELAAMDQRSFAVERLGVGDWPRTDGVESSVISVVAWQALRDPHSRVLDPVCLAFDVSPDRSAAIAAAGRRADGLLHVEVLEHRQGVRWLPGRLAELVEAHEVEAVVCAGDGPVASVVAEVEEAEVAVETLSGPQHTQACGRFVDLIDEKQVRHLGSHELAAAVKGAKTRPLGDAWAWSRKHSNIDICPLVAATLAVSRAALLPDDASSVAIY